MTYLVFIARFPEFRQADQTKVEYCLADATARCSALELGDSYDEALGLLAADILATSPGGGQARPTGKDKSLYRKRYEELVDAVTVSLVVV